MGKKEYMSDYRKSHTDSIKASRKAYYEKHKERTKKEAAEWAKTHPTEFALQQKAAAANKRYKIGKRLTVQDIRDVIAKCGSRCHWCSKPLSLDNIGDMTLEHLFPVNDPEALVIACRSCNSSRCSYTGRPRLTYREKQDLQNIRFKKWWHSLPEDVRKARTKRYNDASRARKLLKEE